MPASASDNACTHIAFFATAFEGLSRTIKQLYVVHVLNHFLGRRTKRVVGIVFLQISLKRLSVWAVFDLLHEFPDTIFLSLFHNRMWQSGREFWSRCQPRLTLGERDLCHGKQRVSPVLSGFVSSSKLKFVLSREMFRFPENGMLLFEGKHWVSRFYHDLDLVDLDGNFWIVTQLLPLVSNNFWPHLFRTQLNFKLPRIWKIRAKNWIFVSGRKLNFKLFPGFQGGGGVIFFWRRGVEVSARNSRKSEFARWICSCTFVRNSNSGQLEVSRQTVNSTLTSRPFLHKPTWALVRCFKPCLATWLVPGAPFGAFKRCAVEASSAVSNELFQNPPCK